MYTSQRRILFVIGSLDVGGAERHLVQILPLLCGYGWRPEVFCLSHRGELASVLDEHNIPVHVGARLNGDAGLLMRGRRLAWTAVALIRILRRRQPEIVHFFLPAAYLIGGVCALIVGKRRLVSSRRSLNFYQKKHPVPARIERLLHRYMSMLVGNSLRVVEQLAEEGVPAEKRRLIHNGISISPFDERRDKADVRDQLGIARLDLVIVVVANLIVYKGHLDLLDAIALATRKLHRGWRLLCVGRDDGILTSLKERAIELGIADNIEWLGLRHDIPRILASADIGVLTSHEEGFSNAVLEYMAAGLPTIVTDVGGNSEAVLDGVTGLVVPAKDSQKLADAIERLSCNETLRVGMGLRAAQRVREKFSLDRCVSEYDELYTQVLKKR